MQLIKQYLNLKKKIEIRGKEKKQNNYKQRKRERKENIFYDILSNQDNYVIMLVTYN